jgi:tripartite-type tricarboxylate transporter receptor subunit TctC
MAGVKMVHVPYKGIAPAMTDLMSGEVQLMFGTIVALVPHIQAGKLRPLAVTSRKRSALLPEVPTLAESGLPDYQAGSWYGVLAPAGTPREIIERLHGAVIRALQQPEVSRRLAAEGAEVIGSTPEEFGAHIKSELARVGKVVRAAGIRIE